MGHKRIPGAAPPTPGRDRSFVSKLGGIVANGDPALRVGSSGPQASPRRERIFVCVAAVPTAAADLGLRPIQAGDDAAVGSGAAQPGLHDHAHVPGMRALGPAMIATSLGGVLDLRRAAPGADEEHDREHARIGGAHGWSLDVAYAVASVRVEGPLRGVTSAPVRQLHRSTTAPSSRSRATSQASARCASTSRSANAPFSRRALTTRERCITTVTSVSVSGSKSQSTR